MSKDSTLDISITAYFIIVYLLKHEFYPGDKYVWLRWLKKQKQTNNNNKKKKTQNLSAMPETWD